MVEHRPKRFRYEQHSHISGLLWHFLGPKDDSVGYPEILTRLEAKIAKAGDGGTLAPWLGHNNEELFYRRKLVFKRPQFGTAEDPTKEQETGSYSLYWVNERRAVCFCDIPVSSLPLHMEKYGDIGLGFRRRALFDSADDLRPVRYFPLKSELDLTDERYKRFWQIKTLTKDTDREQEASEINLDGFMKIPTKIVEDYKYDSADQSEPFESIYEEREWRSISAVTFSLSELAFILIPERGVIPKSKFPKINKLIENGIGVIVASDLYKIKAVLP